LGKVIQEMMKWAKLTGIALAISVVVGTVAALIFHWPMIQGIFILCFIIAAIAMIYASLMFVGTPDMRYDYLVRGKTLRRQGREKEVDAMEAHGLIPALIAVTLMLIGFALEASMH
jgi:hypothetical protein